MKYALYIAVAGMAASIFPLSLPAFQDPLETPAKASRLATSAPLMAITAAGKRLVTAGQRGHILFSDDEGKHWEQAKVPISSTLTAIKFVTPKIGWAVGHSGVVLTTGDGGKTWKKLLDGRKIGPMLVAYYKMVPLEDETRRASLLSEAKYFADFGPDKPFLDLYFKNKRKGFVVGQFNLILRTTDGGKTWTPWQHRTDNPQKLNLYSIDKVDGQVYLAGEQGLLLKLDRSAQRFEAVDIPYNGNLYGVTGKPGVVIVYGMGGNVFASRDRGRTWRKVRTPFNLAITAGTMTSNGRLVIASLQGRIAISDPAISDFSLIPTEKRQMIADIIAWEDRLIVVGIQGIRIVPWRTTDCQVSPQENPRAEC